MAIRNVLLILAVCIFGVSCSIVEKVIDPAKKERKQIATKVYEKDGLSFSYPDNWNITEDTIIDKGIRHVNIEDADNSIFVIQIMSSDMTADLEDMAETFMSEVSKNVPIGKVSNIKKALAERAIAGQSQTGVRRNYSITLFGEVVPHTVEFFLVEASSSRALITIQLPDEDLKAGENEIKIISDSLEF